MQTEIKQEFQDIMAKACEQSKLFKLISSGLPFWTFLYPALQFAFVLFYTTQISTLLVLLISLAKWLYLIAIALCVANDKSQELFWSTIAAAVILGLRIFFRGFGFGILVDAMVYAYIALKAYRSYKKTAEYQQLQKTVVNIAGQATATAETARESVAARIRQRDSDSIIKTRKTIAIVLLCIAFVLSMIIPFVHVRAAVSNMFGLSSSLTDGLNDLNEALTGSRNDAANSYSAYASFLSADNYSFFHLLVFGLALDALDVWGYAGAAKEIIGICSVSLVLAIALTVWAIMNIMIRKKINLPGVLLTLCYVFIFTYENFCAVNYFDSDINIWSMFSPLFPLIALLIGDSIKIKPAETGAPAAAVSNTIISQISPNENRFLTSTGVEDQPADTGGHRAYDTPRYCGNCGAKLPPSATFCQECGAKVLEDQ